MAVFEPAGSIEWAVKFEGMANAQAGNLQRAGFEGWVVIAGVEWSIEREWGTGSALSNRPMNAPKMEQLTFTRETDLSSIQMYYWSASGTPLGKVLIKGYTIEPEQGKSGKQLDIYTLECDNSALTKVAFSPDPMTDNFELSFSKLTWTYNMYAQNDNKVEKVGNSEHSWDYLKQTGT